MPNWMQLQPQHHLPEDKWTAPSLPLLCLLQYTVSPSALWVGDSITLWPKNNCCLEKRMISHTHGAEFIPAQSDRAHRRAPARSRRRVNKQKRYEDKANSSERSCLQKAWETRRPAAVFNSIITNSTSKSSKEFWNHLIKGFTGDIRKLNGRDQDEPVQLWGFLHAGRQREIFNFITPLLQECTVQTDGNQADQHRCTWCIQTREDTNDPLRLVVNPAAPQDEGC